MHCINLEKHLRIITDKMAPIATRRQILAPIIYDMLHLSLD